MYRFIIIFIFLSQIVSSQNKSIKADTSNYWYKSDQKLYNKLNLRNLKNSDYEFSFRFRNQGQIVQITKDSSNIEGFVLNYIYHTTKFQRNENKIRTKKKNISSNKAKVIYELIKNSKVLELKSGSEIENWSHGADGITYIIEHSNENTYNFKSYWTPTSQDSIPEAILLINFIDKLSNILDLKNEYSNFKEDLPRRGCYNSGGVLNFCYVSNSLGFGYSGASKLPLGFYTGYTATFIGKKKINIGTFFQYNFDNDNHYHLNFGLSKWDIFIKKKEIYDFISYSYQNRKLSIEHQKNEFENHQIKYGVKVNGYGIASGIDIVSGNKKNAIHLNFSKWFSNQSLSTNLSTSFFNEAFNYRFNVNKYLNLLNGNIINGVNVGISYEQFFNYRDIYFDLSISL